MNLEREVPKGWACATIPEMIPSKGIFVDGDWIESKDQDPNGDVRLIQLADIGDGDFKNKSSRFLTLKRANELNCTFLQQNDILVARMPDPIGRACLFPLKNKNSFVTAVDVAIIRISEKNIMPKYLMFSINSLYIRREIESLQSGTTRKRISRSNLAIIKFPVPPLSEQQRIVANIEELFSSLDKGIESLKTAQQQLKVYRQAVLKWAFEGKLTNENVKEGELPEGWKWVKLEEIIQKLDQGWSPKCENRSSHSNNEWAVIKTTAVQSGYFIETENKVLPKNLEPRKQHELRAEDILITRTGPRVRVGICCMVKHVRPKLINCDKVYRIKVKEEKVIPNYFAMILNSPDYSDEIEKMKTGISDSGVNLTQKGFLQITIKLPPIKEQRAIVAEIESRLSVCDKIEESIEQSLGESESLRQSILKKAFEGKLVSQDRSDEPASKLLERIRVEKESLKKSIQIPTSKRREV